MTGNNKNEALYGHTDFQELGSYNNIVSCKISGMYFEISRFIIIIATLTRNHVPMNAFVEDTSFP